jgi:hypothetical protein
MGKSTKGESWLKDPEILLLLEIGLANKMLGAHLDQSITSVHKRKDHTKDRSEY